MWILNVSNLYFLNYNKLSFNDYFYKLFFLSSSCRIRKKVLKTPGVAYDNKRHVTDILNQTRASELYLDILNGRYCSSESAMK